MTDSKPINLVFRIAIFASFALCMVSCSLLIFYAVDAINKIKAYKTFELLNNLKTVFKLFKWLMYLFIACSVMSVLTRYKATLLSMVVRTLLLLTVSMLLIRGNPYIKAFDILADENVNTENMSDERAKEIFEKHGMSKEDADQLLKEINQDERIETFFSGIVAASVVSFLLSLTSLHNLVKRESLPGQIGQGATGDIGAMYAREQSNTYYDDDNDDF